MPLGKASLLKLATCQPELRRFAEAVAEGIDNGECPGVSDLAVLCGYRGEKEQNEAFAKGASKLQWPHSKHNHLPAFAVDLAPLPDRLDRARQGRLRSAQNLRRWRSREDGNQDPHHLVGPAALRDGLNPVQAKA